MRELSSAEAFIRHQVLTGEMLVFHMFSSWLDLLMFDYYVTLMPLVLL